MSNPITSVPGPSDSDPASDPLAGIITQVSPNSAAAPSRGGPARPTRVAKPSEKKKKKREEQNTTAAAGAAAATTTAAASVEATSASKAGPSSAPAEEAATAEADDAEQQSHSQKPSSTVVGGTTTTKGSTLIQADDDAKEGGDTGMSGDKPVDASATPTEPDPSVASSNRPLRSAAGDGQQDLTVAAQKLTDEKPSVSSTVSKSGKTVQSNGASDGVPKEGPTSTSSEKTATKKDKKKKTGFAARLIAILTCSMAGGSAIAAAEESSEKKAGSARDANSGNKSLSAGGGGGKKTNSPGKLSPRPAAKGSRAPSQRGSLDNKTAGGGTRLPRDETGDVMSGAVVPPGSSFVVQPDTDAKKGAVSGSSSKAEGQDDDDDDDDDGEEDGEWIGDEHLDEDEDQTEEQRLIMQGGMGIPRDENGKQHPLLGPIGEHDSGRKCLVLDLDETLVHSSFKMISNADFTVPVEIEGSVHNVYVIKRPGVDEFMRRMGELYEVVVFTASLSKYADPVLDILDIHQVVRHRLFRESCYNHRGNYVKDLSQLGRDIETSIIIDNSPASYIFHPNNAVPISSWFNDPHDTELTDLCPFLAELSEVEDVRAVLDGGL